MSFLTTVPANFQRDLHAYALQKWVFLETETEAPDPKSAYLLSLECREFAIAYSLTLAGPPQTHSITKPVPAQSWAGSDVLAATFGSWASTTHDMGRIYCAIH